MGFLADRPVRHRAGREAPDDVIDGFDLVQGDRFAGRTQLQQPAQGREPLALIVDEPGVLLENRVLAASRRVLQLEHRVGIEEVILAVATPLVFATGIQLVDTGRLTSERALVTKTRFLRDDVDPDAADA